MSKVLLGLMFLCGTAQATIYMSAIDPVTHAIGMGVISSGPVVTYNPKPMTGMKGVGFVGWSGSAANVNPEMDRQVFEMMRGLATPDQISAFVDQKIHNKYSRYMFLSAINGTLGYVFPPRGCAQPECGVEVHPSRHFMMMGGGLQKDVVANAMKYYEKIHGSAQLKFECKVLLGLQSIINVGGEIKAFEEAQIGIDSPAQADVALYSSTVGEAGIIADLRAKMAAVGINCPVTKQITHLKAKSVRGKWNGDL